MPYIADFEQFFNEAEKMYLEHPAHVRFATAALRRPPAQAHATEISQAAAQNCAAQNCALHHQPPHSTHAADALRDAVRHCDGKLILKADDRVCLKFQTDRQTTSKMERLNNLFFARPRRGPAQGARRGRRRRRGQIGRVGEAAGGRRARRARKRKAKGC